MRCPSRVPSSALQAIRNPHRTRYGHVLDSSGHIVDDALLTFFAAPHSYTGEDVVEISTHGAPVVVQTVVQLSLVRGARLAHAGEFTERAFLNGRLDLTQAEAVRDLIDSSTVAQARLAAEQLGGSLQREVRPVKDALVLLIAAMEAGIDFAEDDLETMPAAEITARIHALRPALERLLASFAHGRLLREGLRLAIVGPPNAGKSSLFNKLLERGARHRHTHPRHHARRHQRARHHRRHPRRTAGHRGLARHRRPGRAHRAWSGRTRPWPTPTCCCTSSTSPPPPGRTCLSKTAESVGSGRPAIRVLNKADLLPAGARAHLPAGTVLTSTVTGEGMDTLRETILRHSGTATPDAANATLTNTRQRDSIARTLTALDQAAAAAHAGTPHEMILLDLYEALQALDALTGQTTADDVLNQIFSTFCIGK